MIAWTQKAWSQLSQVETQKSGDVFLISRHFGILFEIQCIVNTKLSGVVHDDSESRVLVNNFLVVVAADQKKPESMHIS